jgi:GTP cyclohydrolase I
MGGAKKSKEGAVRANGNIHDDNKPTVNVNDAIGHMQDVLTALGFDWVDDPNMRGTPQRWVKMMMGEVCSGCYAKRPKITTFPNAKALDQLYVVGPMTVRSLCSHHLLPVVGQSWVVLQPGDKLPGLSKFARLNDFIMRRPQMQEEATEQLADEIESMCKPKGLLVVVRATHFCMTYRGVKHEASQMVTQIARGSFRSIPSMKDEALDMVRRAGG